MKRTMKSRLLQVGATVVALAMTLTACGGAGSSSATNSETAQTEEAAQTVDATSTEAPTVDPNRTSTANSDERYDKVTIAMASAPQDLGPTTFNDTSKLHIYYNFYESLFDLRNNEYVPILAKGYTEVDDLHWDVEIYDNIYDSEGNHITASDVVFSINLLVDSGTAVKYDIFDSVEVKDDYTVTFTWTKPVTEIGELEWPWCRTVIISQAAYESGNFANQPIATGPYKVTEFVAGSHVTLEANDNYWQTDELRDAEHMANVQTIEYDFITETSQHVIALSTGQIQYSEYVPSESLADFMDGGQYSDNYDVYVTQGSALYVLECNQYDGKLTSDINMRQAIFNALDNEAIAAVSGTCSPVSALGTPFFDDYDSDWETAEGNYMAASDLEAAKSYLEQTGYNGETLKLLCTSVEEVKSMATMIQSLLLQIGVNVEIVSEEEALLQTDMLDPDKWDLLIFNIGGGSQVGEWNRIVNNEEFGTGYNMSFIQDDTLQTLFETASSIEGHTKENMMAVHDYILQNAYYYAMCTPTINAIYDSHFAQLTYREHEFLRPGSCEYYLD